MNKKGFTLIELLAVIVVLAIIALIATPIILGVIEDARKSSVESSALGYIDAVEKHYAINMLDETKTQIADGDYNLPMDDVKIKGQKPTSGNITINKGIITKATMCINGYEIVYDGKTSIAKRKDNCSSSSNTDENHPFIPGDNPVEDDGELITRYSVGDKVTLKLGSDTTSEWYVIESSDESKNTVKLLKATNIDNNTYAFDENYSSSYETSTIKSKVDSYGTNLSLENNLKSISLITKEELINLGCNLGTCSSAPLWVSATSYWTMSGTDYGNVYAVDAFGSFGSDERYVYNSYDYGIRPVITVLKKVVIK